MNKCNWFEDVFLKSLLDRAGVNNGMWLSAKQIHICENYMEHHSALTTYDHVHFRSRTYYTYDFQGRKVVLDSFTKNGCGIIKFGFNADEQEENRHWAEDEERKHELNKIAILMEIKPESVHKMIVTLVNEISEWKLELEEAIAYGDSEEDIAEIRNCIDKRIEKLELIKSVMMKY